METEFNKNGIPKLVRHWRYLFRFVRADNKLMSSIQQCYLWFSNPQNFNDPFDCRNVLDANNTAEEIFRYVSEFGGRKLWTRAQRKEIASKLSKDKHGHFEDINAAYLEILEKSVCVAFLK
jgi:hypothetical protein